MLKRRWCQANDNWSQRVCYTHEKHHDTQQAISYSNQHNRRNPKAPMYGLWLVVLLLATLALGFCAYAAIIQQIVTSSFANITILATVQTSFGHCNHPLDIILRWLPPSSVINICLACFIPHHPFKTQGPSWNWIGMIKKLV